MPFAGMGDLQYPRIVRQNPSGLGAIPRTRVRLPAAEGSIPHATYLTSQDMSKASYVNLSGVGEVADFGDVGALGSLKKKLKKLVRKVSPIHRIKAMIDPPKPKVVQVVQVQQPAAPTVTNPPAPTGTVPPGTPGSWVLVGTMPDGTSYSYNFPDQASATAYGNQVLAGGGQATASLSQIPEQQPQQQINYQQPPSGYSSGGGYSMPVPQEAGSIPTPQSAPPQQVAPPTNNVPPGTPGAWAVAGTMPDGTPFAYFFPDDASATSYAQSVANAGGNPSVYTPEEVAQGLVPGHGPSAAAPAATGGGFGKVALLLALPAAYLYMKSR